MTRKRSEEGRTREHSSEHSRRKHRKVGRSKTAGERDGASPVKVEKALPVDAARTSPVEAAKTLSVEGAKALSVEGVKELPVEAARALLEACEGTVASLSARLALMVSADFVPCENTARTKISRGDVRERCSA